MNGPRIVNDLISGVQISYNQITRAKAGINQEIALDRARQDGNERNKDNYLQNFRYFVHFCVCAVRCVLCVVFVVYLLCYEFILF